VIETKSAKRNQHAPYRSQGHISAGPCRNPVAAWRLGSGVLSNESDPSHCRIHRGRELRYHRGHLCPGSRSCCWVSEWWWRISRAFTEYVARSVNDGYTLFVPLDADRRDRQSRPPQNKLKLQVRLLFREPEALVQPPCFFDPRLLASRRLTFPRRFAASPHFSIVRSALNLSVGRQFCGAETAASLRALPVGAWNSAAQAPFAGSIWFGQIS
jgi:hypothetical protein